MPLSKILKISGRGVYVAGDDIDTDRIIPARFMKCLSFDGLGEFLFHDVRYREGGEPKAHPLNDPRFDGASILLTGNNFGCGSSREHAPQALYRAGFRAIIAEGYAEIFFGNATTLGMPCVTASKTAIQSLVSSIEANPATALTIDLKEQQIHCQSQQFECHIRETARQNLINGAWDPLQELLENADAIDAVHARSGPWAAPLVQNHI